MAQKFDPKILHIPIGIYSTQHSYIKYSLLYNTLDSCIMDKLAWKRLVEEFNKSK